MSLKTEFEITMTVEVADNNGPMANSETLHDEVVKAMAGIYHQQLTITKIHTSRIGRTGITPKVIPKREEPNKEKKKSQTAGWFDLIRRKERK